MLKESLNTTYTTYQDEDAVLSIAILRDIQKEILPIHRKHTKFLTKNEFLKLRNMIRLGQIQMQTHFSSRRALFHMEPTHTKSGTKYTEPIELYNVEEIIKTYIDLLTF